MNILWLRIKLWTKVVIIAAIIAYVITFIVENKNKTVHLWLWYKTVPSQDLLSYTLIIFFLGVIAAILARTLRGTIKQFRQLRQASAARRLQRLQTAPVRPSPPPAGGNPPQSTPPHQPPSSPPST